MIKGGEGEVRYDKREGEVRYDKREGGRSQI